MMSPSISTKTYNKIIASSHKALDATFSDMPTRNPIDVHAVWMWARGFIQALVSNFAHRLIHLYRLKLIFSTTGIL